MGNRRFRFDGPVIFCTAFLILATWAGATSGPRLLAPGDGGGVPVLEGRCPTFHWSGASTAIAYDLVVYSVGEAGAESATELYRISLPGDVRSWTASADRCFEGGGHHAWSVRAVGRDGSESWSEVGVFRVELRPSVREVEDALSVLRRYVNDGGSETGPAGAPAEGSDPVENRPEALRNPTVGAGVRERLHDRQQNPATAGVSATPTGADGRLPPAPAISSTPSLVVDEQVHLGTLSQVFKSGTVFLWDEASSGNLGLGRGALPNPSGGGNTAIGRLALGLNTSGLDNTALGFQAMTFNSMGDHNTAIGKEALHLNQSGRGNTSVGWVSLSSNTEGNWNSAFGSESLKHLESGLENVAIGERALRDLVTGRKNIGIGQYAGGYLSSGSYNIFLGSYGLSSEEENTIRIGDRFHHDQTFIAGNLALGFEAVAPEAKLVVRGSEDGTATVEADNIVWFENTDTQGSADVLALKIGEVSPLESGNNFITFLDGNDTSMGAIEGDGAGGVTTASSGADYAEFLERVEVELPMRAGDVVGLFGNRISRTTEGANRIMVISTAPIVLGNDPGEENRERYERVAFIGQAPVRVVGPVRPGDAVLASGRSDGTAVARPPTELEMHELALVLGRALEGSGEEGEKEVSVMVGVPDPGLVASAVVVSEADLRTELAALRREIRSLRTLVAGTPAPIEADHPAARR